MGCCNETDIRLNDKTLNSTYRFRFTIKKDKTIWQGIDAVTATFTRPDNTSFQRSLVAEDVNNGIWYYDTTTSDLNQKGYWNIKLLIVDSLVSVTYQDDIGFQVK